MMIYDKNEWKAFYELAAYVASLLFQRGLL